MKIKLIVVFVLISLIILLGAYIFLLMDQHQTPVEGHDAIFDSLHNALSGSKNIGIKMVSFPPTHNQTDYSLKIIKKYYPNEKSDENIGAKQFSFPGITLFAKQNDQIFAWSGVGFGIQPTLLEQGVEKDSYVIDPKTECIFIDYSANTLEKKNC